MNNVLFIIYIITSTYMIVSVYQIFKTITFKKVIVSLRRMADVNVNTAIFFAVLFVLLASPIIAPKFIYNDLKSLFK